MVQFFSEYRELTSIGQRVAGQFENDVICKPPISILEKKSNRKQSALASEDNSIRQLPVAQLETAKEQLIMKNSLDSSCHFNPKKKITVYSLLVCEANSF